MKKLMFTSLCVGLFATGMTAQEMNTSEASGTTDVMAQDNFNKWSIEVNGGVNKPMRPISGGYFTNTPDFLHLDLGVRYMFNEKFGLKLDVGYDNFQSDEKSMDFESNYYRASLQGVANLGRIMNWETWTRTFNLLGHAGAGYSQLRPDQGPISDDHDQMMNWIAGLTGQVKLSDHVALTADFTTIAHSRQDYTFDGMSKTSTRGFDGIMFNASVGITFYLGKAKEHADWYLRENDAIDNLAMRVSDIEGMLQDTDRDGVPDYLDQEPNTPTGVSVDRYGKANDLNENGIPDDLESALDMRYASKESLEGVQGGDPVKRLLNDGYVNVYFGFSSSKPAVYSFDAINYLVRYMNENQSAQAELLGYADEIGGDGQYNNSLSERRAKAVYDILVASGVSESRLSYKGMGVDDSVNKSSANARQIVRRVTFKLK
ncbi:OmpA-OmpF porin, OOP family [Sinomicrobium oceani]|uniref:OmpA-OmpF porin, OOP family n=2 Tax=Sinomicrobium oceani TaxID=1150368 RepID=A0A1K1RPG6_9FLAO|nr:OmpA family protein [Sinomicrobium oceani]SFW73607.1 OmpA-OmpF porin, OOP family [Sinomicrobium oceani]